MLLAEEYYEAAVDMARKCCCPDCWSDFKQENELEYASEDDDVLVCKKCNFWINSTDLEDAWIEAYTNEYGEEPFSDDEYDEEQISVYEAADIWASHGKDEDYMFGYTEDELESAL